MAAGRHPGEGAIILPFPIDRIRRARPEHELADRATGGKVVFLSSRLPLRAQLSADALPPAA